MASWYKTDNKIEKLEALNGLYSSLKEDCKEYHDFCRDLLSVYSELSFDEDFLPSQFSWIIDRIGGVSSWNVSRQATDTLFSKLGKNKPRTKVITSGADFSLLDRGLKLQKFLDGIAFTTDLYNISRKDVLLPALILGTGAWKTFPYKGNIRVETPLVTDIFVDKRDGKQKKPRQILQRSRVAREVLLEQYPECEESITLANSPMTKSLSRSTYDELEVKEVWHLKSSDKSKDGQYCIFIENDILYENEYDFSFLPFEFYRFAEIPNYFWGQGVPEILMKLQVKLNSVNEAIDRAIEFAVPWVLSEKENGVELDNVSNENMVIIEYNRATNPPKVVSINPIPQDLLRERQEIYSKSFETIGLSELSAASLKPSGLDAAVALREFRDIESERHSFAIFNWEANFLGLGKKFISLAKSIAEDPNYGDMKVNILGDEFLETINWKEVAMDEDVFVLQLVPSSSLRNTFAGRINDVTDLMKGGLISSEEGRELLIEMPDLERFENTESAARKIIQKTVDTIYRTAEYSPPEPFDDIAYAFKYGVLTYSRARQNEIPEENQQRLRDWISDCKKLMAQAEAEAQQQAMAMQQAQQPQGTQARPEAQPTSDLMSQVK